MEYIKPPLSFEAQAELLISRGIIAEKQLLIERLKSVNYYRLSGYLFPFRSFASNNFQANTYFSYIWRNYTFDRHIRLLVLDAIERLEIAMKTKIAYHFAFDNGAFGYLDNKNLPQLSTYEHEKLLKSLKTEFGRSNEDFVKHFSNKYSDKHDYLPIWMIVETISFGNMVTLYQGADNKIKQAVAKEFGVPDVVLQSWLKSLNLVRNICAHHSRLWNRKLIYKPMIPNPNKYPDWHKPFKIDNDKIFGTLTILKYILSIIAPQSQWTVRLIKLFEEYNELPFHWMGFPRNWKDSNLWKNI